MVDNGTVTLVRLAGGVLFFHVLNSVLQEAVFHLEGFHHAIALSFLQTIGIAFFALINFRQQNIERKAPLLTYFFLSICSTASVILTNQASHMLNYPTQVIFKSSKLLFIVVMRFVLFSPKIFESTARRPLHKELLYSFLIVTGLVLFTWATTEAKKSSESVPASVLLWGVAAIVVALICDGLLYLGEEKFCFGKYKATNAEVILFCFSFVALNSGVTLVSSGQLEDSLVFVAHHPSFVILIAAFSLCNFIGTHFLLRIVAEFDSSSAVMVTSVRKMFTVLCSFAVYPKPFTALHAVGLVLVSCGIFLFESLRSQKKKEDEPDEEI